MRKKLSLEGNTGMLPRAQTLNTVVFFPSKAYFGHEGVSRRHWGSPRAVLLAPAGCDCRSISVWIRRLLLKRLSLSARQTLLRFTECTSWIPFRWNSSQKVHSRSGFNALGLLLLGVEPMGAKQSEPTAQTSSHYRRSPIVPNNFLM